MDKRTFFFVVALSLSLFVLNIFFQQQNEKQRQEWVVQQKHKQEQKNQKLEEELAQRTASPSSLPLVKVYADPELQHFLIDAVLLKDQLVTFAWQGELPKRVYAGQPSKAFELANRSNEAHTLVIYQATPSSRLPVSPLSPTGRYDLQLVYFNTSEQHPVDIQLGEYQDGKFLFPLAQIKEQVLTAEQKTMPALALLKTQEGYIPTGIYWSEQQAFIPLQQIESLAELVTPLPQGTFRPMPFSQKVEEKFFVLENTYQQLVFSNYGGALAEINLPFHNKENPKSVVREIEFDRQMVEQHPSNAHFPAHGYYTSGSNGQGWKFHEKGQLGGYYPLLRRDLIETGPRQSIHVKPQYYALNVVSEYPEVAELIYEVKEFTPHSITFEAVQHHRRITKTFYLGDGEKEGPYCLNMEVRIEGDGRGLWLTTGIPEVEWISGASAPSLKYRITRNQKVEVENIDLPKEALTVSSIYPDWLSNSNGFLGMILDPLTAIDPGFRVQFVPGTVVPSRLVEIDQQYERFKADNMPGYLASFPLKTQGGVMKFRLFAGPFDEKILKAVDRIYSDQQTGYNPDYIACQTMHGWFTFISEPFAKLLLILLNFFHQITGSWAFSIILLTICLRVILYPLNAWSTRSMLKMQQVSPEIAAIQEKYKKDPKKAQVEIMNLYREKGINPASGCLPLLIQMPFLIGMFDLLKSSFALRGAPFIPGWIDDLTAPDVLFSWSRPIFFFGNEFHLLPILLGLVMFIQQRYFSNAPQDPKLMTDQQRQQRAMGNMMTVVFAIMFYNFPSGLNIYWLSSMLLGMLQQWFMQRRMKQQEINALTSSKPKAKKAK